MRIIASLLLIVSFIACTYDDDVLPFHNEEAPALTYVPDDHFEQELIDLGYDNVLDDYVATENIVTLRVLDISSKEISDLTGIEDFISLIQLDCSFNNLEELDLTYNTKLTTLIAFSNQLHDLNITQNKMLLSIVIYSNQLRNLDISQNTALAVLDCPFNRLRSLDTSKNTALTILHCPFNFLTSLDISQNPNLSSLKSHYNSLTSFNASNGNNTNLLIFRADRNPFLDCIQIDVGYIPPECGGGESYWCIDPTAIYSSQCN